MNGKQFLAEIKSTEKSRHIPVIIYSTSSEKKDIHNTTQLGALYFFQKPNRFQELSQALADIISGNYNKVQ